MIVDQIFERSSEAESTLIGKDKIGSIVQKYDIAHDILLSKLHQGVEVAFHMWVTIAWLQQLRPSPVLSVHMVWPASRPEVCALKMFLWVDPRGLSWDVFRADLDVWEDLNF